jgi:hypothetical protein
MNDGAFQNLKNQDFSGFWTMRGFAVSHFGTTLNRCSAKRAILA